MADDAPLIEEEEWDIKRYCAARIIDLDLVSQMRPKPARHETIVSRPAWLAATCDPLLNQWAVAFKAEFPTQELVNCCWPVDWWEAFKERWFTSWMKKRWPVQYDGVAVTQILEGIKLHRQHYGSKINFWYHTTHMKGDPNGSPE